MQNVVRIYLLVLASLAQAPAFAVSVDEESCLARTDAYTVRACQRWANQISADKERLVALGHHLEVTGNYQAAVAVYKVARKHYASNKSVLKRLIRAQSEWRGQQLLAEFAPRQSVQSTDTREQSTVADKQFSVAKQKNSSAVFNGRSDCWRLRWAGALDACQRELEASPDDAALHERLADVHRSLGQPEKALYHYRKSLDLRPDNLSASRKHRALAVLIGEKSALNRISVSTLKAPADARSEALQPLLTTANEGTHPVIQQLELLDDLHDRKLISRDEYRQKRDQILEKIIAASQHAENTARLDAGNQQQKTVYRSVANSIGNGRYYALVIGNNRYRDFPALQTAVNDATAVSDLLSNRYGFSVETLIDTSRYDVLKALSKLRKQLKVDDKLLIYYAGHGVIDEATKRGYWLPIEAEPDNVANWISANDVTDSLSAILAKHAIVVADSCYSGSLLRSGGQADLDQRAALLKRLAEKRSRTVLTSGGLEPVLDDGDGTHSVFARAFIDILSENDDLLEAGRLFSELRSRVVLNADQTPQYAPIRHAGHDGGDFIFIPR